MKVTIYDADGAVLARLIGRLQFKVTSLVLKAGVATKALLEDDLDHAFDFAVSDDPAARSKIDAGVLYLDKLAFSRGESVTVTIDIAGFAAVGDIKAR